MTVSEYDIVAVTLIEVSVTDVRVRVTTADPTLTVVTTSDVGRIDVKDLPVSSKLQNKTSPLFLEQE